ncbi:MAG: FAD-binding protein, partial [Bacteroidia bacterium]|nr:FAD-binding protein [Bacteroidia bacterium]
PMRIYPAVHYTMGGLWVDYNLSTNIPGLYALGEANFSDHGANRLGASALMQGLADGYFVIPYTLGDYLAGEARQPVDTSHSAFKDAEQSVSARIESLLAIQGKRTVDDFHRELGKLLWDNVGITREAGRLVAAKDKIKTLQEQFWRDLRLTGTADGLNQSLEKALRVADFLELGEIMLEDALVREESCGCHLREEFQSAEGEPIRNDDRFCDVAAWESTGNGTYQVHRQPLQFENVKLSQRSYK